MKNFFWCLYPLTYLDLEMIDVSKLRSNLNISIVSFSTFLDISFLILFKLLFFSFYFGAGRETGVQGRSPLGGYFAMEIAKTPILHPPPLRSSKGFWQLRKLRSNCRNLQNCKIPYLYQGFSGFCNFN